MHRPISMLLLCILLALCPVYAQIFLQQDGATVLNSSLGLPECASRCAGALFNVVGRCTPNKVTIDAGCFCADQESKVFNSTTGVSNNCPSCNFKEGSQALNLWYDNLCTIKVPTSPTSSSTTSTTTSATISTQPTISSASESSVTTLPPSVLVGSGIVTLTSVLTRTLSSNGVSLLTTSETPAGAASAVPVTRTIPLNNGKFTTTSCYFLSTQTGLAPRATGDQNSTLQMCGAAPHGLSTPAKAGIGAGSAVGGLLVVLAGLWLCIRRKRTTKRARHGYGHEGMARLESDQKRDGMNAKHDITVSAIPLNNIAVERADDSEIKNSMQDLNEFTHQHVENHYHTRSISDGATVDLRKGLKRLGYTPESSPSLERISSLLCSPQTRKTAIRHLIAFEMFEHIGHNGLASKEGPLLTGQILASYKAFQKSRRLPSMAKGKSILHTR